MPPIPKPEPRRRIKDRAKRQEAKVIAKVRAEVSVRDGSCRLMHSNAALRAKIIELFGPCEGVPEWAHLNEHRRSATRGMEPEERHTTAGSAMLCTRHHAMEEAHRIRFEYLTDLGADGPMSCTSKLGVFVEEAAA